MLLHVVLVIFCSIQIQEIYCDGTTVNDIFSRFYKKSGHIVQKYDITTKDGYILGFYRIPPKENSKNLEGKGQPFLLMHGLLSAGTDYILLGKNKSLACMLHDKGYDVWIGNARGNTWSKKHIHIDPVLPKFWNFTWHEIGIYDLPAAIDRIIEITKMPKIHYVGHSQGTTVLMVMLCEYPEYNKKIASATLLSPVAFLHNNKSPLIKVLVSQLYEIEAILKDWGIYEFFPFNSTAKNFVGMFVNGDLINYVLEYTIGISKYPFNKDIIQKIMEVEPAGISVNQLTHYGQIILAGKFQKFDYRNNKKNFEVYGQNHPPEYNLSNIQINLQLYEGTGDLLVDKRDVKLLMSKLNSYTYFELDGFNHVDFIYSKASTDMLYSKIISNTKKFL